MYKAVKEENDFDRETRRGLVIVFEYGTKVKNWCSFSDLIGTIDSYLFKLSIEKRDLFDPFVNKINSLPGGVSVSKVA